MTKKEAWLEDRELTRRGFCWNRSEINKRFAATGCGLTPYQKAMQNRVYDLYEFWRRNDHMPIVRAEWEKMCPARDVTETVEDYFRNSYDGAKDQNAWKRKMAEAGGKLPGFDSECPDFERFKDAKPLYMEG